MSGQFILQSLHDLLPIPTAAQSSSHLDIQDFTGILFLPAHDSSSNQLTIQPRCIRGTGWIEERSTNALLTLIGIQEHWEQKHRLMTRNRFNYQGHRVLPLHSSKEKQRIRLFTLEHYIYRLNLSQGDLLMY